MLFSPLKKWSLTVLVGLATLAVSFNSSAYSGGAREVIREFGCSTEIFTLGISLFVLGFAIGPLIWGPFSELYGRQILFIGTYGALTAFNAGAGGAKNIETLVILRFWAGAFGSSPLTNAGGVIADMFAAKERGLALAWFSTAPFMGPAVRSLSPNTCDSTADAPQLGPIVGGFVGETIGWRWLEGIMAIFAGILWIVGSFVIPETYAPVLLRKRAAALSKATGRVYASKLELAPDGSRRPPNVAATFKTALSRPWVLLFREPIVTITSVYMAIIYGTLYMLFAAFPIVFQQQRGWSEGIGGLAFIGVAIGFLLALAYIIPDNDRFASVEQRALAAGAHFAPPEARLPPAVIGAILLPIGLFWFAWTNYPSIHWAASIAAGIPFGAGMVLVFLSIMVRQRFLQKPLHLFRQGILPPFPQIPSSTVPLTLAPRTTSLTPTPSTPPRCWRPTRSCAPSSAPPSRSSRGACTSGSASTGPAACRPSSRSRACPSRCCSTASARASAAAAGTRSTPRRSWSRSRRASTSTIKAGR